MQVIFVFLLFFQLIFVPSLYSADHVHKISIPCADDVYKLSQGTISGLFKSKNDKFIKNLAACCVKKESNSISSMYFESLLKKHCEDLEPEPQEFSIEEVELPQRWKKGFCGENLKR